MEEKRKEKAQSSPKKDPKVAAEADLSYMDSPHAVGSYDPDKESRLSNALNEERDCVRCICGFMEDDGGEIQCDRCKFWLHIDCVNVKSDDDRVRKLEN